MIPCWAGACSRTLRTDSTSGLHHQLQAQGKKEQEIIEAIFFTTFIRRLAVERLVGPKKLIVRATFDGMNGENPCQKMGDKKC